MKLKKRIVSALLCLSLMIAVLSASVSVDAVTTFTVGDYTFSVIDSASCLLYSYNGSDTSLELPFQARSRYVIGIDEECFENSSVVSVTIPDTYESIGNSAFYHCKSLSAINIPSALKTIGNLAFAGCEALGKVDFGGATDVTEIPYAAFAGTSALTEVVLPKKLSTIGNKAFDGSGITSVELKDTVTSIGTEAFANCASLTELRLPESISTIPSYAFRGCSAIETVRLPSELEEIGDYAFADNTALSGIEFPSSLRSIGANAFENDAGLEKLFIPDTVENIGANALAPMSYRKNIEVTCYKDSYAAQYCYENNVLNLVLIDRILGDTDCDGVLSIMDVTLIQKYTVGTATISYRGLAVADVNGDDEISIRDATYIQMDIAGIKH